MWRKFRRLLVAVAVVAVERGKRHDENTNVEFIRGEKGKKRKASTDEY